MVYISTSCVKAANVVDAVKALSHFTGHIELSGGSQYQDNLLQDLVTIKTQQNIDFLVHSYFPPPKTPILLNFADTGNETREFITESMHFVEALGVNYYSVHAGFKSDFNLENEILDGGSKTFSIAGIGENITWFEKHFSQKIALENLHPNLQKDTCYMAEFNEILQMLNDYPQLYLLLDLGHLKVSSRFYGFNYLDAVKQLFSEYADRILELHLSENHGSFDDHHLLFSDSAQYMIVDIYKEIIKENNIKITIEARGYALTEVEKCYYLISDLFYG